MNNFLDKKNKEKSIVPVDKRLGLFIQMARKESGITQKDLALKLNTTQNQIARWETGAYEPLPSVIQQISKLTNKPVSFFFGEAPPPVPQSYDISEIKKEIMQIKEQMSEYKSQTIVKNRKIKE